MADIRFNAAGHLDAAPTRKTPNQRSPGAGEVRPIHRPQDHRWIDYPLLAVLAAATIAFWVGVAYLLATAWKN
jgi:hypothetical protein